jgi:PAS domain S-box-containing protein
MTTPRKNEGRKKRSEETSMSKPSYEELEHEVEMLSQIANLKVYPEIRDLLYFRINKDWYFDFIDKKVANLTGYAVEDFLEEKISWLDVVHAQDRESVQHEAERALKSDLYYSTRFRIVRNDGNIRWIKMRGPIFCDSEGEFSFIQGVINDISSEKTMEEILESEREVFSWVANSCEDGIYVISEDYRIKFMNKALISLVGDHVGKICYESLFQRDTVCPWSVMNALKQESCGFQEYTLTHLGKIFQVRSFPIKMRDGTSGKLGQLKDITEHKKMRHEIEEFAARHEAIEDAANLANLGIFVIQDTEEVQARFLYANEAFCRITGYDLEELLGISLADLVHPDYLEETLEGCRLGQSGLNGALAYEIKMIRKDGVSIIVFFSVATTMRDEKLAITGFLRDITMRIRVQQSLWRSQRLASIGKLASEIAHEINNPLTSVLTFAKLMKKIVNKEPFPSHRLKELQNYVSMLESETTRCSDIARNLLDFSRQGQMEIKENNIHQILEKTLGILRHRAELNEITIHTSYAQDVPALFCDFKRLQQVFINIFWNAIEAMPEGGLLDVSTSFDPKQNMIRIDIRDTGCGICEENLERIFEPFFTTKAEVKGVGLGLSVAYGIVRQHHGEINVQSNVGEGTHFAIQLPTNASVVEMLENQGVGRMLQSSSP